VNNVINVEGEVYACGANECGQLGVGTKKRVDVPTLIHFNETDNHRVEIATVAVGSAHSLALTTSGQLYVWGFNSHGQLGLSHTESQTRPVLVLGMSPQETAGAKLFADGSSSALLTRGGALYTWGCGLNLRLMQGGKQNYYTPTRAALVAELIISRFTFSPTGSAVCVASQLTQV
jgi:alpha-tubulin suppressor-like RCC1 family protein